MSRRRRGILLAGLALVLGGLAASDVAGREAALQRRVGPAVEVVVARAPLAPGTRLTMQHLGLRRVPARFAPRGGFASPADLVGRRVAGTVAAGSDLTTASLDDGRQESLGPPVRRGERVADVVAAAPAGAVAPGGRVDVLVTREARSGAGGRTALALQDVEVLGTHPAAEGKVQASLRVTLRQAVYLAAAGAFSREIRLLPRADGDHRRGGGLTVTDDL